MWTRKKNSKMTRKNRSNARLKMICKKNKNKLKKEMRIKRSRHVTPSLVSSCYQAVRGGANLIIRGFPGLCANRYERKWKCSLAVKYRTRTSKSCNRIRTTARQAVRVFNPSLSPTIRRVCWMFTSLKNSTRLVIGDTTRLGSPAAHLANRRAICSRSWTQV